LTELLLVFLAGHLDLVEEAGEFVAARKFVAQNAFNEKDKLPDPARARSGVPGARAASLVPTLPQSRQKLTEVWAKGQRAIGAVNHAGFTG
jgi:hypothetical protein